MRTLVIAAPMAAGLYAAYRHLGGRFGWLLMLAAVLWSPTMLAESSDDVLYSVGRVWVWFAELLLVYLVLAFPSGRLVSGADRLLFRAGALVVSLNLMLALVGEFPEPSPWASCGTDCPPNAFMLPSAEPGFVDAVLLPVAQATSVIVLAGVAVQLLRRLLRGTSLMRLELVPVLAAAVLRIAATVAFLLARGADPNAQLTEVLGAIAWLGTPVISVGFLIGLVLAGACRERAGQAERSSGPTECAAIAGRNRRCGRRSSLEIVYRTSGDPAEWVDDRGRLVTLPEAAGERATTEIRSGGVPVAALIHDPALAEHR